MDFSERAVVSITPAGKTGFAFFRHFGGSSSQPEGWKRRRCMVLVSTPKKHILSGLVKPPQRKERFLTNKWMSSAPSWADVCREKQAILQLIGRIEPSSPKKKPFFPPCSGLTLRHNLVGPQCRLPVHKKKNRDLNQKKAQKRVFNTTKHPKQARPGVDELLDFAGQLHRDGHPNHLLQAAADASSVASTVVPPGASCCTAQAGSGASLRLFGF